MKSYAQKLALDFGELLSADWHFLTEPQRCVVKQFLTRASQVCESPRFWRPARPTGVAVQLVPPACLLL